ncbi:MAG: tryptophan synthase subunit alpha, partial [Desulfovibrionaceae bacterium]|nr:tryptophan synthase subunit alpha [Desulfovibrionaceae bacterium]
RAATASGRQARIPFLPAGFPDKERFFDELAALDASGADVIEIGVPFSDPVADGPVVERASLESLERGVSLAWLIGELTRRKARYKAGLVLMGYFNPFFQYGLDKLAYDAARAGVSGLIVPDLPFEESYRVHTAVQGTGVSLIPLIGLNTPEARMRLYAERAEGFVYFVSVMGVTGVRGELPPEIALRLDLARSVFNLPLALGFGVKSPDQLTSFGARIDAVVFGSSLIDHLREGGQAASFMDRWK